MRLTETESVPETNPPNFSIWAFAVSWDLLSSCVLPQPVCKRERQMMMKNEQMLCIEILVNVIEEII
jgi:hypothetical protein